MRWYKSFSTNPVELYIFADASEKAYGAVAYRKQLIMAMKSAIACEQNQD